MNQATLPPVAGGTITELRTELFAALKGLSDKSLPIDRAKAIADVAQTIINSAKVEVDFLKVTGGQGGSGFIPLSPPEKGSTTIVDKRAGVTVTQHRLKG